MVIYKNNNYLIYNILVYFIGSIIQGTPKYISNPAPLDLRTNNKVTPPPTIMVETKPLGKCYQKYKYQSVKNMADMCYF